MSTFQRLTLIGLYNHYPELFKNLTLPAAYNAETFVDVLLLDQGEKRVAYPEPEFFSFAVGVWSRKWAASLERIALAMTTEYNPLHNYDRFEEWTDKESGEYENNGNRIDYGTDKQYDDGKNGCGVQLKRISTGRKEYRQRFCSYISEHDADSDAEHYRNRQARNDGRRKRQ